MRRFRSYREMVSDLEQHIAGCTVDGVSVFAEVKTYWGTQYSNLAKFLGGLTKVPSVVVLVGGREIRDEGSRSICQVSVTLLVVGRYSGGRGIAAVECIELADALVHHFQPADATPAREVELEHVMWEPSGCEPEDLGVGADLAKVVLVGTDYRRERD